MGARCAPPSTHCSPRQRPRQRDSFATHSSTSAACRHILARPMKTSTRRRNLSRPKQTVGGRDESVVQPWCTPRPKWARRLRQTRISKHCPCTARLTVRQRQPSWPKQGRRPARRAPRDQLEASNPIETRCHEVGDLSLTIATFINSHVHVSTHTHVSPLASP